MVRDIKMFLLLLGVVSTWSTGQSYVSTDMGYYLQFTPVYVGTRVTASGYEVGCYPDDRTKERSREIISMEIRRSPTLSSSGLVATLRQASPDSPILTTGSFDKYAVSGHVGKDIGNSFIQVTVKNPGPEDAGLYTCNVHFIGWNGQMSRAEFSKKMDIVDNVDQNLKLRLKNLEQTVKTIQAKRETTRVLGEKLKDQIAEQASVIKDFQEKASIMSAFAASNSVDYYKLVNGTTMEFPNVITNVGGDYEDTTSQYTSPRDGVYAFHLTITTGDRSGLLDFHIVKNGETVANLQATDVRYYDMSSVNTVLRLKKGDIVKTFIDVTRDDARISNDGFTVFSGFLVKSL